MFAVGKFKKKGKYELFKRFQFYHLKKADPKMFPSRTPMELELGKAARRKKSSSKVIVSSAAIKLTHSGSRKWFLF